MAANITSFTLSFCYGCRYSQHTCWSFGFWLLGHWLEACLRAYGIWTKLHFPKLHESFLEKRLGKPGCALFTWLERIGSSAYWNAPWSYHQTAKGDMCNSNWWMKSLFLAGSLLVSNTFSPINLTTRQSRVTCARPKQCKSNRWKTFLFLADTITFPQIKTTTTSIVLHLYPLAVGRFPARPVWTSDRFEPSEDHALSTLDAGRQATLGDLRTSMRLLGQLGLHSYTQKKLISTPQFSSGESGHL